MLEYDEQADKILPAQLEFLAIYNPSLGKNEATEKEQIVFYYAASASKDKHEQENESMRQIGLAQGMINLAR